TVFLREGDIQLSVAAVRNVPASAASADLKLVPAGDAAAAGMVPAPAPASGAPSVPDSASVASTQSAPQPPAKPAYPKPAAVPTQQGPKGVRFDFNQGCRVSFPPSEHPWQVRFSDLDTGNILFQSEVKSGAVHSTKRYFIRFRLEVGQQNKYVFRHDYSAAG